MMEESRTKNATRNMLYGLANRFIGLLFPFLSRTAVIYILGMQYVGLSSLFGSVLGVLSLTELGIGSALVYSMYKPIAEKDYEKVGELLLFYKKCYRAIGLIIFALGMLLLPNIDLLIGGEYPDKINIYALYFMYLINTVISYFMFAYKQSLFLAFQRNDIISKISSACSILLNVIQILILITCRNYYYYIIVIPLLTCVNNVISYVLAKKYFPFIVERGSVRKEDLDQIKKNVFGLVYQKIGGIVLASTDSIIISAVLGLKVLGQYNSYHYIVSSIVSVFAVIPPSVVSSIGNSQILDSKEKNYRDFKKFHLGYNWLLCWAICCFCCLAQPFVRLWVGDEHLFSTGMVILFAVYLFFGKVNDMSYIYREAAGLWQYVKYAPLIAAVLNLLSNICLVKAMGLPGILISTILANVMVYIPAYSYTIFKYYFQMKRELIRHFEGLAKYFFHTSLCAAAAYFICSYVNIEFLIFELCLKFVICMIVPNICMYLLNFKTEEFADLKNMIQNYMKRVSEEKAAKKGNK